MIHFDVPRQKPSIIKVLGVGGGGSNAVNYMYGPNIENVSFIICNTDVKALEQSMVPNKVQLGPLLTQGLGAGANPDVGRQATEESLEELRRILEPDTKMVFITAGMGGGTGTGGAPIIAKICRDLGVLTVGIVTTPFGFEGPRRLKQAQDGIRQLQPYVDTLLVISNDKLRVQYGDLKMKEAFFKADNVLATATKCITDIINSRGHIIVDFADVCTVMKNGGVAILGSSAIEGEDRAQRAIEEALNSPLLNDSEIFGAKWILININSAEGDYECTMDELEIINNHLRAQAGDDTDVIVGMGYDNSLERKIGITLIATGFEHKDPFTKTEETYKKPEKKEEKIFMTLGVEGEEKKMYNQQSLVFEDKDAFAPRILQPVETEAYQAPVVKEEVPQPVMAVTPQPQQQPETIVYELAMPAMQNEVEQPKKVELVEPVLQMQLVEKPAEKQPENKQALRNGFLSKPMNIYSTESVPAMQTTQDAVGQPTLKQEPVKMQEAAKPIMQFQAGVPEETVELTLTIKEGPETSFPKAAQPFRVPPTIDISEEEEQRRKAAERIAKLRNISFNMNTSHDANGEFDSVPAYVRRNMELFGSTLTSVENYYSKINVAVNSKPGCKEGDEEGDEDGKGKGELSTRNKFLHSKRPD